MPSFSFVISRPVSRGMRQAENRSRKVSIAEDRYALLLLPALLLLLLEALLPEAWYARRRFDRRAS